MRSSISRRLIWMNMLISGAVLVLACLALMRYDVMTFCDSVQRNLSMQAGSIGSNSISALLFNDADSAQKTLEALRDAKNVISAGVYTPDGTLFAGYQRQPGGAPEVLPSMPADQAQVSMFHDRRIALMRRIT